MKASDHNASVRGSMPALVESFAITGLYGYRSISLSSDYAATVLIAKNGSGKTTLLGALDAFLRCQFSRLRDLEFSEITCKLRGINEELVIKKSDVREFVDVGPSSALASYAVTIDVTPSALFRFIMEEYGDTKLSHTDLIEDPIYSAILKRSGYSRNQTNIACEQLKSEVLDINENIRRIYPLVKSVMSDIDVVYLPTYRRIELPLIEEARDLNGRRRRPKFRFAGNSLFTADIQFGLKDISERLSELNQSILVESNQGYRQFSANIINELIDGTFDKEDSSAKDIPNKEELTLFFARLKDYRNPRSFSPVSVPNIDKIYNGQGITWESNKFLRYFLGQLSTVIAATRDIERRVEDFISSCNRYLSTENIASPGEFGVDLLHTSPNLEDKVLRFNRQNLKVHVESVPTGRKISIDALSSGEKQMVSLFAKLFLYPREKLVLIDEPELSLSIDWQRQILVDVVNAPLCRQVIAITHSPFVFDNDLETFAKSLQLSLDLTVDSSPADDDERDADLTD